MIKPNPFVPKSGLEPKVFINRDDEIAFFLKKVDEAKTHISNHYVITGKWGQGKTTLLKHLKNVAQQQRIFSAYLSINGYSTPPSDKEIVAEILQLIAQNLPVEPKPKGKLLSSLEGLGIQVLGTGFDVSFHPRKDVLISPQILFQNGLVNLWEDYKNETDLIVVLMDDVQNFENVSPIFTLLKNVLSSDQVLKTKYLFVLSSTIEGWDQFMIRNHPIGRYFIPIVELENFTNESTVSLVNQTLADTGVFFSAEIIEKIYQFTAGHLFEVQALCNALYEIQVGGNVHQEDWERGFHKALQYLGRYVFEHMIKSASATESEALYLLAQYKKEISREQLFSDAKNGAMAHNISGETLKRLIQKHLVENHSRGMYQISDIMFREYILQTLS